MKAISIILMLTAAMGCGQTGPEISQWKMQKDGSGKSWTVTAPCTVAGALNEAGYFGENVLEGVKYQSIDKEVFDHPWVFTAKFQAPKDMKNVLKFNSLGYSADIVLNGETIASADTTEGPFCVREFDISSIARKNNTLKVTVHKAPAQSLNHGWVDWNPRPVDETMGILGKVELISTPHVQVKDVFVCPIVDVQDFSNAVILVSTTLVNLTGQEVSGTIAGKADDGIAFDKEVTLAPGETQEVAVPVDVENPRIWWSAEMGTPELYDMDVCFRAGEAVSNSKHVRFGIRSITSEIDANGHRQFILNGRKVLIKSAGWTDDIFMQDTPESLLTQVEMVRDMGLNSIRFENIWGKDDTVYDICDSLGILTMVGFSCQWEWEEYCGLPQTRRNGCITGEKWEDLAVRYFHDQVMRLRNHASLIGWLTGSDRIPIPALEERYMAVYDELEYRSYICSAKGITSSVSGASGMKMEGPYEYVGPDYWFIDTRRGGAYGFNTETNPGLNIPQKENVVRMVGEENIWPISPVWDYHCTASASHMNNMDFQVRVMNGTYGEAVSFEDYVKKAHALDYDSTRSMFEAFRAHIDRSTGIVQWMLNSAWPSMYWQLYDWYNVPTAGYYGVKHACAPVQLIYDYGTRTVVAVNDAAPEARYAAEVRFYDKDSRLAVGRHYEFLSEERNPVSLEKIPAGDGFLSLELKDMEGNVVARNFYCVPAEGGKYLWDEAEWWGCPMESYADLSFVTNLPKADVAVEQEAVSGGIAVKLTNKGETIAYNIILKAVDGQGHLVGGPVWEDNFISLCPGETRTVMCADAGAEISIDGWNL